MSRVQNIVGMMSNLRDEIISAKQSFKMQLNDLTTKIDKAVREGNILLAQELEGEKSKLLIDFNYLKSIDEDNTLTYDTLGYHIKGYELMCNKLKSRIII